MISQPISPDLPDLSVSNMNIFSLRSLHTAIFSILCLTFVMAMPMRAHAFSVDNVRVGVHPDKVRVVLDLSNYEKFRVFTLTNPYRLVVDLPSFDWQSGAIKRPPGSGVTDLRQGKLNSSVSRIVIDLKQPAVVQNAFLLRKAQGAADRLVIDFKPVSLNEYNSATRKIFGVLDVDGAVDQSSQVSSAAAAPVKQKQPVAESATQQQSDNVQVASSVITPVPKPQVPAPKKRREKPTIIIDPGHGGADPGAIAANGVFEKNITLALARELKKQLEASGEYKAVITRDRDVYIKLYKRVEFARKHKGDLFVSIHADTIGKSSVKGMSVYTLSEKASDAQTAKLAQRENNADKIAGVDLSVEDEQVADILVDLVMRDTQNQSNFFAKSLVGHMKAGHVSVLENPHRHAGFAVLKAPDIPSVLVEAGFLSNKAEARLLSQPDYQRRVAGAIKNGIDAYFEKIDSYD